METLRRHAWACSLQVGATDLRHAGSALPQDGSLRGQVTAEGALKHDPSQSLTGHLAMQIAPGSLVLPGDAEPVELLWDETAWRIEVDESGASGQVRLELYPPRQTPMATLELAVEAPGLTSVDALAEATPVTGRIRVHIELGMLDYLSSALAESEGAIDIESILRGTTRELQIDGKMSVRGKTFVRPLGIELSEIDVTSEGKEGRLLLDGTVRSGDGRLQTRADWSRWPTDSAPSTIVLQGERFQAASSS
jgi:hypothetical protein